MIFPNNAIDIFISVPSESIKYIIVNTTTPKTILGFDLMREKVDKSTQLWCDNIIIFDWSINSTENFEHANIQCSQPIYLTNNTTKPAGLHLVYTDYNLSLPDISNFNDSNSLTLTKVENGNNDFYVNNVWSNGELIIAFLLSILLVWLSFGWLFSFIFPNNKIKITKRDV